MRNGTNPSRRDSGDTNDIAAYTRVRVERCVNGDVLHQCNVAITYATRDNYTNFLSFFHRFVCFIA